MQDVRAYRGADIASDHQLLVAKFKIKIARATKQEQTRNRKFNIQKLNNPELNREFSIKLSNRFQDLAEIDDGSVDKQWKRVKTTYNTTCQEELGFSKKEYKTWLSDNTIEKIEMPRSLKTQLDDAKTRLQKERLKREHTLDTKNVKKETRNDKRNYINELASKAEDAMARNDTKTVYNITRQLAGRKTNTAKPVKDKDGKNISSLKQQLKGENTILQEF